MTLSLVAGAVCGGALCLLIYALVPPRPAIGAQVGRFDKQRARATELAQLTSPGEGVRERVGRWAAAQLAERGVTFGKLRQNLELIGTSYEAHLATKLQFAAAGFAAPIALAALAAASGGGLAIRTPLLLSLALAAGAFWLPDLRVKHEAERRRAELMRALSSYLDAIVGSLAGAHGIPQALQTSAQIYDGWAWRRFRSTLAHARLVGDSPWKALHDLGKRTGVKELQDLGSSLLLAGTADATIRDTLTSRARSLREKRLAEVAGAAERAGNSIRLGHIVLGVGFLVFLGFAAFGNMMALNQM